MEKNIENRATEFALKTHPYEPFFSFWKETYVEIATEQKAIDDEQLPLIKETYYNAGYETAKNKMIDKACEWLSERCAFGVHPCSGTALVMEFRKVMEE